MACDAVIFDLFGTLVYSLLPEDYAVMLGEVSATLGVPTEAFSTQWHATTQARESGTLGGVDALLIATAAAVGRTPSAEQVASAHGRWLEIVSGWMAPREDAMATVQAFRGAGCKIGLLSNCSAEVPPIWARSPLASLFDATVFSCEVGAMKPDRRVYDAACERLGVQHARCLFVGDGGSRELTGAAATGMEAALIRVPSEGHPTFDSHFRPDRLDWPGTIVESLSELTRLI